MKGKFLFLLNYTKIRSNGHQSGLLVIHPVFSATEAHSIFLSKCIICWKSNKSNYAVRHRFCPKNTMQIFAGKNRQVRLMTSGFYRNSESVCGFCWKNALCSFLNALLFHSLFPVLPFTQLLFCDPLSQPQCHWKTGNTHSITSFPQAAPCSTSSHVVSALCHLMATFYTDPSQKITAPRLYSSFPFSPCFILSQQTFFLPLLFSLLTLYQRHFDQLVSVLSPEQPRSLLPWLLPAPWLPPSYTSRLKQCSLCSHFLPTVKGVFLSQQMGFQSHPFPLKLP